MPDVIPWCDVIDNIEASKASPDRIEQAKLDFADLYGQVVWLADRLSEARILVNNDQCSRCTRMSFEACKLCWIEAAAKAVREGRHSK